MSKDIFFTRAIHSSYILYAYIRLTGNPSLYLNHPRVIFPNLFFGLGLPGTEWVLLVPPENKCRHMHDIEEVPKIEEWQNGDIMSYQLTISVVFLYFSHDFGPFSCCQGLRGALCISHCRCGRSCLPAHSCGSWSFSHLQYAYGSQGQVRDQPSFSISHRKGLLLTHGA